MIIFDVLGSMRVTGPQGPIHVQAPMQRRLLALFLAHAGQAVELDWAADQLWRGRPPKTARKTLIVYVHRLRRLMGLGDGLAYQPAGHTLNPAPGALDSWEFQSLGDEAAQAKRNGDPTRASELAEQALALWRGPAFADVRDLPAVEARARGLDEQRLNLIEEWADSELMLGRHVSLTGRLASTCAEYQYRERLQGLMMLALYRSGRPADALAHYRQTRQALAEELGIEPTVELDQLHRDILHNETSLAWRENRSTIVLSGRRFLPPCVPDFTGRVHELEWLNGSVVEPCGSTGPIDAAQIRAIVGMAGIGKTALAVHWAHSVAARFPDGQLYLDLRGTA